jgi:hypothetical protein
MVGTTLEGVDLTTNNIQYLLNKQTRYHETTLRGLRLWGYFLRCRYFYVFIIVTVFKATYTYVEKMWSSRQPTEQKIPGSNPARE